MKQPIRSLCGKEASQETFERQFEDLYFVNACNGGMRLMHKTILYLEDRYKFEYEWIQALTEIHAEKEIPVWFYWGAQDTVSPMRIPRAVLKKTNGNEANQLQTNEEVGHFLMLEGPQPWLQWVTARTES